MSPKLWPPPPPLNSLRGEKKDFFLSFLYEYLLIFRDLGYFNLFYFLFIQ